jgi:repressor LexA
MATETKHRVLKFINEEISAHGICPTLREIGQAMNFSHEGVRKIVIKLEREGYLQRRADKFRAIKILRLPAEVSAAA